MKEDFKLDQAQYFLCRMQDPIVFQNDLLFRYNLGAFLASARSVMQYARDEAQSKGQRQWYDSQACNSQLFRKFKDYRDEDVHRQCPVAVATTVSCSVGVELWGCDDRASSAVPHQAPEMPVDVTAADPEECEHEELNGDSLTPHQTDAPEVITSRLIEDDNTYVTSPDERNECVPETPSGSTIERYTHPQRFGQQDVVSACEQYLQALRCFVADGQKRGILSVG